MTCPPLATHTVHARAGATVRDALRELFDVAPTATGDSAPGRPVGKLQQAMVLEEPDERRGRIRRERLRRRRPDGSCHRQQMIAGEGVAVAVTREELAERGAFVEARPQRLGRRAVETRQVAQHRPEAWARQIAALREQARERTAAVFEGPAVERHGERHIRRRRLDAEMIEKSRQVRIVERVEDYEAGVDRHFARVLVNNRRIGVAAEPRLAIVERNVVATRQQPGGRKPRDARPDHRYFLPREVPAVVSVPHKPLQQKSPRQIRNASAGLLDHSRDPRVLAVRNNHKFGKDATAG